MYVYQTSAVQKCQAKECCCYREARRETEKENDDGSSPVTPRYSILRNALALPTPVTIHWAARGPWSKRPLKNKASRKRLHLWGEVKTDTSGNTIRHSCSHIHMGMCSILSTPTARLPQLYTATRKDQHEQPNIFKACSRNTKQQYRTKAKTGQRCVQPTRKTHTKW